MTIVDLVGSLLSRTQEQLKSLARMASQSIEEVIQVAWEVALNLYEQSHSGVTNSQEIEENFLRKVRRSIFAERLERRRFAQLDRPLRPGEDNATLLDTIAAPLSSDPLHVLLSRQELDVALEWAKSFSEFVAYAHFIRNSRSPQAAAEYLATTLATLTARVQRSLARMKSQPSLFDGVQRIDPAFLPKRGVLKLKAKIEEWLENSPQLELELHALMQ